MEMIRKIRNIHLTLI